MYRYAEYLITVLVMLEHNSESNSSEDRQTNNIIFAAKPLGNSNVAFCLPIAGSSASSAPSARTFWLSCGLKTEALYCRTALPLGDSACYRRAIVTPGESTRCPCDGHPHYANIQEETSMACHSTRQRQPFRLRA